MVGLPNGENKFGDMFSRFGSVHACDRRIDRHSDDGNSCALHSVALGTYKLHKAAGDMMPIFRRTLLRYVRLMSSAVRLSSVTLLHAYEICVSAIFLRHLLAGSRTVCIKFFPKK